MGGLTQQRLKELLHYNKRTGIFTWTVAPSFTVQPGQRAGCLDDMGYVQVYVDGKNYRAHRMAWLYVKGIWPDQTIDHINGVRDDNAFDNLRDVSHETNQKNLRRPSNNTSGTIGVSWNRSRSKWESYITVLNKKINLGQYTTLEEAQRVRQRAEIDHGFHINHGSVL